MSLFSAIAKAEHSTAAWFEKEWAKIHADAPKITDIADRVLPYVSSLAQIVIGAEAGAPAAALVGNVLGQVQKDLDVANAVIYDTGATPTATSAVTAIQTNLSGLLTAGHISNATNVATITKAVNELGVLIAALPAAPPPTTPVA